MTFRVSAGYNVKGYKSVTRPVARIGSPRGSEVDAPASRICFPLSTNGPFGVPTLKKSSPVVLTWLGALSPARRSCNFGPRVSRPAAIDACQTCAPRSPCRSASQSRSLVRRSLNPSPPPKPSPAHAEVRRRHPCSLREMEFAEWEPTCRVIRRGQTAAVVL